MRKPLCAVSAVFAALLSHSVMAAAEKLPDVVELNRLAARLTPVDLKVDLSGLPKNERESLAKQVAAARLMDAIFLRQVWAGNESVLLSLLDDHSPLGRARLTNFLQQKGPWDRIEHNHAFIPGVPEKPAAGNFYPAGATKEEVGKWIDSLVGKEGKEAKGFFHTIRRETSGKFTTVPYSLEYQGELAQAADLLREAAKLTAQPSLRKFLEARADAFISNDYYDSDVAWMEMDASLEPTIGPYEVYEDDWFNYKAAFEAFIAVRDEKESAKLAKFSAELQGLENNLPIDPSLRNPKLGALAPIKVVNVVFNSGDGNRGVQTAAYNLPNDERITQKMGSKRVMLKNMQEAKFDKVLLPIARIALAKADQKNVQFDPFFTFILMHELMHGLGPHEISVGGRKTTARQELKEISGAFEEAKADISGLWALQQLVDKGVIDKSMERTMYDTYLAGAFRTLRFGITEAHGKGMAMQLNWLLDQGGVKVEKDGTFAVVPDKVKPAVTGLTHEIMTIQARGDYNAAKSMLDQLGVIRPEAAKLIAKMEKVPVDISPRFVTADALSP
ncbi:MAG TPA: hypothetical protein VFB36_00050 [Nevskiaceae bacterium]|nr:hypothetical protein [Nevskiaceae bacterium]